MLDQGSHVFLSVALASGACAVKVLFPLKYSRINDLQELAHQLGEVYHSVEDLRRVSALLHLIYKPQEVVNLGVRILRPLGVSRGHGVSPL